MTEALVVPEDAIIEEVIDRFVEEPSVAYVATELNLSPKTVRLVLDTPEIAGRVLRRKAAKAAFYVYTKGIDRLLQIVETSDKPTASIAAMRELRSMMEAVKPETDVTDVVHEVQKTVSLEDALDEVGD